MSNHIDKKFMPSSDCGCKRHGEIKPSRLDLLIAQYESLIQETTAYRDSLVAAAVELEDIAKESNATSNKQAVLEAIAAAKAALQGNDTTVTLATLKAQIASINFDKSDLAKEQQATLNKREILEKISAAMGLPCVEITQPEDEYKTVTIRNISLALLKKATVRAGVQFVNDIIKFRVVNSDGDKMLYITSDSYAPLAGEFLGSIADENDIIDEISFDIDTPCMPSVFVDGINISNLYDNVWRLAQIQNKLYALENQIANINIDTTPLAKDATVAKESAATTNKNEVKANTRTVAGDCIVPNHESVYGLNAYNMYVGYVNDGDFIIDTDNETELDDLQIGDIVRVIGLPTTEFEFHVPKTVDESRLYSLENIIYGITESILVEVGKCYIVTGMYDDVAHTGNSIFTYAEVSDMSVTDLVNNASKRIEKRVDDVEDSLRHIAKQGTDSNVTLTEVRDLQLQEGIPRANAYAAEINDIIGNWSQESESES